MDNVVGRRAAPGVHLEVPRYVQLIGAGFGMCTIGLGLIYLLVPPVRPNGVREYSVVAILEPALGVASIAVGAAVVLATILGRWRAITHGLAAVVHGGYVIALVITVVLTEPLRPSVAGDLALLAVLAHVSHCLDYFQRGHH